jgi:predicted transcriptional regulator
LECISKETTLLWSEFKRQATSSRFEVKSLKRIKEVTPEAFRLIGDETRKRIIFLLRVKELTISQMSSELGMTPQAIYHHIKRLEAAGLVEVTREERIDHLIESYYQATAETFLCSIGSLPKETAKRDILAVLDGLKKIGFQIETNDEIADELVNFEEKMVKHKGTKKLESVIEKLEEDLDIFTSNMVRYYADLILMSEEEYAKRQELSKELRRFLLSICTKKPKL